MVNKSWKNVTLGTVAKNITSGSRDWAKFYSETGDKFVRMTNLNRDGMHLLMDRMMHVNLASDSKDGKRTSLEYGDVLISITAELGKIGWVPENFGKAYINQHIALLRLDKNKVDSKFIAYQLSSSKLNKIINSLNDAGAKSGLNLSTIRTIPIAISSLYEQTKIAQILSTWDKAIKTTEQLIGNSQQQKKSLMQSLLTGKKRLPGFEGEWSKALLGDIAYITTGSSNRQDSTLDGNYAFFDRSEDIRTSNIYLFDCEAVIVPGEGQDFIPKYFHGRFDLHQRTYAIMNITGCDAKFIFFAVSYFRGYLLSQAVGSTVKSLRLPMFKKMPMILPPLPEQQKIAAVLTAADNEIELLQKKLAFLKQEKAALMQQLLTGKRRVKVETA